MPVFNNILAGAAGSGGADAGYKIERSLRFNSADSAYLSKTPSSAGNRKTWTLSCWIKRSKLGNDHLFTAGSSHTARTLIGFGMGNSDDKFYITHNGGSGYDSHVSSAVFRDTTAWYHIVLAADTASSIATARFQLWVNGVQQTWELTGVSENAETFFNHTGSGVAQAIGSNPPYSAGSFFNGYLAEFHFVDGQALDETYFGEFDDNEVWQPKQVSGVTYGTNGFYLDFSDNSSDAALGTDSSGNSNTWTVNNLSSASTAPVAKTSISYAIAPSDYPGTSTSDQSSLSFNNTWNVGSNVTITDYIIIDTGAANHTVDITPFSSDAANSYSDDLINWTTGAFQTGSSTFNEGRYYWIQSTPNAYGGGLTLTSASTADGDSMIDTPTNYEAASGNNGGNYCTWNALAKSNDHTLSNGNLDSSFSNATPTSTTVGTIGMTSGKFYWESTLTAQTGSNSGVAGLSAVSSGMARPGNDANTWIYNSTNGNLYHNGSNTSYGTSYAVGDVIGTAFDADNGNLYFYKNGVVQNSGTAAATGLTSGPYFPAIGDISASNTFTASTNFGQRPFAYTPPTGFKSLCTTNLPDPTIADGSTAMDVKLYTGDGNSTQTISGLSFNPDFIWNKARSAGTHHRLFDVVRGFSNMVASDSTGAEDFVTDYGYITATSDTGFTVGQGTHSGNLINANNATFVNWCWDAGTSTVSNTDGSITSNVRANASAGFSIVSYTGSSSATTVGHGLNAAPQMIIVKDRDNAYNWQVNHIGIGVDESLLLNSTSAATDYNAWNNNRPTSSVFSLGAGTLGVNTNGADLIAYCFAPVEGYSAFGSYTGNGSTDGPFIFTGMKPAFILLKRTDTTGFNWILSDTARDPDNEAENLLLPNLSNAEVSQFLDQDILSNGFKHRGTDGASNASGGTYIYAAFAENPFKIARAR